MDDYTYGFVVCDDAGFSAEELAELAGVELYPRGHPYPRGGRWLIPAGGPRYAFAEAGWPLARTCTPRTSVLCWARGCAEVRQGQCSAE